MTNTKCTNCGLPVGKMGILSPTLDEKRRNQCPKCAREWMCPMEKKDKCKICGKINSYNFDGNFHAETVHPLPTMEDWGKKVLDLQLRTTMANPAAGEIVVRTRDAVELLSQLLFQSIAKERGKIKKQILDEFNKRQIWLQAGSPQTLTPEAYWSGAGFDSCLKRVKEVLDDTLTLLKERGKK
mgnify:CR=1 FL=1